MSAGYAQVPLWTRAAVGAVVLLGVATALAGCSDAGSAAQKSPSMSPSSKAVPKAQSAADKAATAAAAAKQRADIKAAAAKYVATQAAGERAAAAAHPLAAAAAACGIPLRYIQPSPRGSRIGMPDVPKRGNMWHVRATSPVSPKMIIYWPDGGKVLCR